MNALHYKNLFFLFNYFNIRVFDIVAEFYHFSPFPQILRFPTPFHSHSPPSFRRVVLSLRFSHALQRFQVYREQVVESLNANRPGDQLCIAYRLLHETRARQGASPRKGPSAC